MSSKVKSLKLLRYCEVRSNPHINKIVSYLAMTLFLLVTFHSQLNAQTQKDWVKNGDHLITEYKDYYGASLLYKKALEIDSTVIQTVFKYAEALRGYNDYAKAESKYYYIYKKDRGRLYPLAPFWYATMLKYNGKYAEAKKTFKRSKRYFTNHKSYPYLKVINEIKSCEEAIQLLKEAIPLVIKNMGASINTFSSELGATLLNDSTIIYASLRDDKMKENNLITDTSNYLIQLFKGSKQGEVWKMDSLLTAKINAPNFHIANGSLNPTGTIFYYTKCDKAYHCEIYAINYENGSWETPYKVEGVNSKGFTTTQPSIAVINGKEVLFFSSNRPGGEGQMDIWVAIKKENGSFMPPTNAGAIINTIEDEITPFYHTKDTSLYFSSNWHYGLGGFDIFKSKSTSLHFEQPTNMGFPINTSTNDFYYNIRNNTALLTSNRKGSATKKGETCCNDIWIYTIPDTVQPEPIFTTLEELNKYLPVQLYFHNDSPNPRTKDTNTTLDYMETYKDYTRLYGEYRKKYGEGLKGEDQEDALAAIEDLFSEKIKKGADDLALFTPLLLKELTEGKTVTLTIKGFASPLSKSDYNVNLTLRRVSSLINYLKAYKKGLFLPYINGTAANGAKLDFIKVPFGEYQSATISDDLKDKRNSVYSPSAALERKIEIIAIQTNDTIQKAMDGSAVEKLPLLTFKDSIVYLANGQTEKQLKIINNGEAPLKLFSATFSCDGFTIDLPALEIPTFEPTTLKLTYNPKEQISKKCSVEFLTNTIPNKIRMEIVIE
jgi:tetratricopeptide (TPR) repeat protein